MDDDAERGLVFVLGLALGALAVWVLLTARGRRTAQNVFEAAGDLIEQAGDMAEQAGGAAGDFRRRFG